MTPGSEPVPSGLQRNPTSVRSPLLNVTRSRAAAAGFCALAGTRSPSAWTINNARTRVLVTTTLRSRYRIYTEKEHHRDRARDSRRPRAPGEAAAIELAHHRAASRA